MNEPEQRSPSTYARSITVEISRFWTPEEALAVFELIDDLRNKILALHGERLREVLKNQRGHGNSGESGNAADDDRPF
jgi:hypothetical protein